MEDFNNEFLATWGNMDTSSWLTDANNDPFMPSTWNDENGCASAKRLRRSTDDSHNSYNEASLIPSWNPDQNLSQQASENSDVFDSEIKNIMNNILSDINSYGLFSQNQLLETTNLTSSETYSESHILPSDDTLISNEENVLNFIESLPSSSLSPIPSTSNDAFESQAKIDSILPCSNYPSNVNEETHENPNTNFLVEILPSEEETPDTQTDESTMVVNYDTQKPSVVQATFDLPEELQFLEHCSNSSSPPLPSPRDVIQNNPPISESFNINQDDKGKTQYHCTSCSGVLRTYKEATKHFRNKHALYQCSQCPASNFVGYFRMNAHTKKMHKKPSTVHCQCGRGFSSEKGLNKHKLNCPAYQEHMARLRATLKPTYQFLN